MIKVENTEVFGWEAAIRGMRNPMNSWDKCDSEFNVPCDICNNPDYNCEDCPVQLIQDKCLIGKNDLELMCKLSMAGSDHGKFLRMINVTMDITAPLYWWKEFDTYKVGTVANSCSTMHKIAAKEFTLEDFSCEHLIDTCLLERVINELNIYRDIYNNYDKQTEQYKTEFSKKHIWLQMIQLLPSSYNQKRTVQLNYQVLKSMYFARKDHKLDEWHILCDWMLTLPYFKEVCVDTNIKEDDERNA